ncbi:EAL domain-containing response regulator [Zobellella maritima]|uniref:EAL domain-containing response regulator n=1 Tax=Zobellella maritima TaxID=2059725 RepID=UPI000E30A173|nr:EAL domain-containing response regulator [Zobellella maritima]
MTTLVIDDDPFILKMLARQLAIAGCRETITCSSAEQALRLLEHDEGGVGLVILDLQMPEMDGIECVRHLARVGYQGKLLLLSGEDERILSTAYTLAKAHGLNVLDAVKKPISLQQLNQVLKLSLPSLSEYKQTGSGELCDPADLARGIVAGELTNHYQPKVVLANGAVDGVEALVRWQHPRHGLIYPDRFIPVAEQYGMIEELTRAVMRQALNDARLWREQGLSFNIAVNISMNNISSLLFPEFVTQLALETGMPLSHLILEVTESQLMAEPLKALDSVTRLRLKRIGLSIDDFGTGYSSLAQLRDIPFSELKIDRSFVHGAHRDATRRAIFDSTLNMAEQLGMSTVAEGVEDADDWKYLRKTGRCQLAQGYFIGRPMPAWHMTDWLQQWQLRLEQLVCSQE